jgi:DNA-binding IclR family transcriptional regulator
VPHGKKLRLTRHTPKTITTKTAPRAELERTQAEGGMAVEDKELVAGRRALATVVVDTEGWPIAAVELAVPAQAYTRDEMLGNLAPR